MQQDLELHRDWLASINTMANSLKEKINSGANHITPLRNEVNQSFSSFEEQLQTKHEQCVAFLFYHYYYCLSIVGKIKEISICFFAGSKEPFQQGPVEPKPHLASGNTGSGPLLLHS